MNNYYYLVASLPDLTKDRALGEEDAGFFIREIKTNCPPGALAAIEFLESGYEEANLTEDFYRKALSHKNRFLREWFRFDLNVRNAKVRYLNSALGRPADKDVMPLDGGEFLQSQEVEHVLNGTDILARERGIDDILWKKADELTTFHYFDIDTVLGFFVKLKIIDRWLRLDEEAGRAMFRKLVDEVRGTFRGMESAHTEE